MGIVEKLRLETTPAERLLVKWQYTIASNLIRLLDQRGMTQKEFAHLAGLTEAQVTNLLTGSPNPTLNTLAKISAALKVDILNLIDAKP